jgi:dTMP kinase
MGKRGIFITFEGGEGAGKTSLMDEIERDLVSNGYPVVRTREPGGTWLGDQVRAILLDRSHTTLAPYAELALFLASRAQQLQDVILPALKEGKIVLCDRFNDSTIAYQGEARRLGPSVAESCQTFCQGIEPDLTLYLDIDPAIGLERASKSRAKDRIEEEELSFHQAIRKAYHRLAKEAPKRIHLIDASQKKETVFKEAFATIEKKLKHV